MISAVLFTIILILIVLLGVDFVKFIVNAFNNDNYNDKAREDRKNILIISLLILLFSVISILTVKGQSDVNPILAGQVLNSQYTKTISVGYVANVEGMVLTGKDRDNKINKIVFIPAKNRTPVTITDENYNDIIYELSELCCLIKPEVFNSNQRVTVLFNRIDYEVIVKVNGVDDKLNLIIILQKL